MRLIDADALEYHKQLECMGNGQYEDVKVVYEWEIDNAPTIDAEAVIRCKDCRYNTYNPRLFYSKDMIMTYAWCSMIIDASNGEGFCNFAKDLESEEEE